MLSFNKKVGGWALLGYMAMALPAHAELINGIAARVGSELILWSDVRKAAKSEALTTLGEGSAEQVRERLIEDILVADEAGRLGRVIDDTEILSAIDRFAAGNGMSRDALQASLTREGVDWVDYKEIVRKQLLRAEVVRQRVRNSVIVGESDIEALYKQMYRASVEVQLELRPADGGNAVELGWVNPAEVREELRMAILQYASGKANGSATMDLKGVPHAIWQTAQRLAGGPPYTEVKEQLREQLFQERLETAFQNWLSEIKGRTFIERMAVPAGFATGQGGSKP